MDFTNFKQIVKKDIEKNIIKAAGKKKTSGSFNELMFKEFSMQSVNIKMGNVIERSYKEFISRIDGAVIDERTKINNMQIDLLFDFGGVKYCFESKNNINLDTGKSVITLEKVNRTNDILIAESDGKYNVFTKILVNRYNTTENIQHFKTPITKDVLIGYSDLFNIFGVEVTTEMWETFFGEMGAYISMELTRN